MVYFSNRDKYMMRRMGKVTYQEHNYKRESRRFQVGKNDFWVYSLKSQRESWFASLLEILVHRGQVVRWWYEPHRFTLGAKYNKLRVYTPDFLVELGDEDIFDTGTRSAWVEVKSSLSQKDVSRLRWFHQAYPDLTILLMVDRDPGRSLSQTAKKQRVLHRSARKYVERILYGQDWYQK
jgi:hypothetical protein